MSDLVGHLNHKVTPPVSPENIDPISPGQGNSVTPNAGAEDHTFDFGAEPEKPNVHQNKPNDELNSNEKDGGMFSFIKDFLELLLPLLMVLLFGDSKKGEESNDKPAHSEAGTPNTNSGGPGDGVPADNEGVKPGSTTGSSNADVNNPPKGVPQEMWEHAVIAGKETGNDPFVLAAKMEQESQFGEALKPGAPDSPTKEDGVMQTEPGTRDAFAGKFEEKYGRAYDHSNVRDQVRMAGIISNGNLPDGMTPETTDEHTKAKHYNGGKNWKPGDVDRAGRVIKAIEYADKVTARADEMRASVAR